MRCIVDSRSYDAINEADEALRAAGLDPSREKTITLRGPRQGCGWGPVGDQYVYVLAVEAPGIEQLMKVLDRGVAASISIRSAAWPSDGSSQRHRFRPGEWC